MGLCSWKGLAIFCNVLVWICHQDYRLRKWVVNYSLLFYSLEEFVKIVVHITSYYFNACGIFISVSLLNRNVDNLYLIFSWQVLLKDINYISLVLDHSVCYNTIPQTGWLRNRRNLFLTALDAGKSKINVPAEWVSGSFLVHTSVFSQCPHLV